VARGVGGDLQRRSLPEVAGGQQRDRELGHVRRDRPQLLPLRPPHGEAHMDPVGPQPVDERQPRNHGQRRGAGRGWTREERAVAHDERGDERVAADRSRRALVAQFAP
jgi:hypothetical protein